jgi:hypothetical protein
MIGAPPRYSGRRSGSNDLNRFKFKWVQTISNPPNFDQSKDDLPFLRKFVIIYGFEGFEERNNFLHRNLIKFDVDFK